MPELPEVEAVRRGLESLVIDKTIQDIEILWPRIIDTELDLQQWKLELIGQTIHKMQRRGKYLIFVLSQGSLISHLRMEGKYLYYPKDQLSIEINKHSHVLFKFTDGSQLHYNDVRKFGRLHLLANHAWPNYFDNKSLGPEPLSDDFKLSTFIENLSKSQRNIKPLLLDQKVVVGLGNIYVDESLFLAKIHPLRKASSLESEEIESLYHAIKKVLDQAVREGGSTIRTYKNSLGEAGKFQQSLNVYGKNGKPCSRCGQEIDKIKVSQRGTHYCPYCQVL